MVKLASPVELNVEPVGLAFVRSAFGRSDAGASSDGNGDNAVEEEVFEFELDEWFVEDRPTTGKNKGKVIRRTVFNYYKALGLKAEWNSTDYQIKKAYQQGILKFHPDKLNDGNKIDGDTVEDPMFLKIQEAYQCLINTEKRRSYDSLYEFDDSIPKAIKKKSTFYKTYGPVFERNARFSENTPVPMLGDENTPIQEVIDFYQFWGSFESWRNFKNADEHKIDDADGRDEKRWMEQQNKNIRAGKKKEEYRRLRRLFELTQKQDPRLIAHDKAIKEKKLEGARNKIAAEKAAKEAEEKRKAEEETAAQKAKEDSKLAVKLAREKRQKQKKQLKKARKKLTAAYLKFAEHELASITMDDLQAITEEASLEDMLRVGQLLTAAAEDETTLGDAMAECSNLAAQIAEEKNMTEVEKIAKREAARKKDAEQRLSNKKSNAGPPWSKGDLVLLIKATKKFPAGSLKRWEQIAAVVNKLTDNKAIVREANECIKKATELTKLDRQWSSQQQNAAASQSTASSASSAWSEAQQKQLEAGLRAIPSGTMPQEERWKKISEGVEGKSPENCVARFNFLRASLKK